MSPFPVLSVVTQQDIINAFAKEQIVTPCKNPEECKANVNASLYRGLGPFNFEGTCENTILENKKVTVNMSQFHADMEEIKSNLAIESIQKGQLEDESIKKIPEFLLKNPKKETFYFLEKGILKRKGKEVNLPSTIVVPQKLVPIILTEYHLLSHAGPKKLYGLIRLRYFWPKMGSTIEHFCRGCCLCSIYKHSNTGKSAIGIPHKVINPKNMWQRDICQALGGVCGYSSFILFIDVF